MPKPVYQIFLGAFLLAFVAVACNNKKSDKEKEPTKDSVVTTPPANVIDSTKQAGDSLVTKPVDPGTVPKPAGGQ